jgi:hypothetical protein
VLIVALLSEQLSCRPNESSRLARPTQSSMAVVAVGDAGEEVSEAGEVTVAGMAGVEVGPDVDEDEVRVPMAGPEMVTPPVMQY